MPEQKRTIIYVIIILFFLMQIIWIIPFTTPFVSDKMSAKENRESTNATMGDSENEILFFYDPLLENGNRPATTTLQNKIEHTLKLKNYKVNVISSRGENQTPHPDDRMRESARYLNEQKKIILAGSGSGATVAICLATMYPEHVEALILDSPFYESVHTPVEFSFLKNGPLLFRKLQDQLYRLTFKQRADDLILASRCADLQKLKTISVPMLLFYDYTDETNRNPDISLSASLDVVSKVRWSRISNRWIALHQTYYLQSVPDQSLTSKTMEQEIEFFLNDLN